MRFSFLGTPVGERDALLKLNNFWNSPIAEAWLRPLIYNESGHSAPVVPLQMLRCFLSSDGCITSWNGDVNEAILLM